MQSIFDDMAVIPKILCRGVMKIAIERKQIPATIARILNGLVFIPRTLIGFLPRQLKQWKSLARHRVVNERVLARTASPAE